MVHEGVEGGGGKGKKSQNLGKSSVRINFMCIKVILSVVTARDAIFTKGGSMSTGGWAMG